MVLNHILHEFKCSLSAILGTELDDVVKLSFTCRVDEKDCFSSAHHNLVVGCLFKVSSNCACSRLGFKTFKLHNPYNFTTNIVEQSIRPSIKTNSVKQGCLRKFIIAISTFMTNSITFRSWPAFFQASTWQFLQELLIDLFRNGFLLAFCQISIDS